VAIDGSAGDACDAVILGVMNGRTRLASLAQSHDSIKASGYLNALKFTSEYEQPQSSLVFLKLHFMLCTKHAEHAYTAEICRSDEVRHGRQAHGTGKL